MLFRWGSTFRTTRKSDTPQLEGATGARETSQSQHRIAPSSNINSWDGWWALQAPPSATSQPGNEHWPSLFFSPTPRVCHTRIRLSPAIPEKSRLQEASWRVASLPQLHLHRWPDVTHVPAPRPHGAPSNADSGPMAHVKETGEDLVTTRIWDPVPPVPVYFRQPGRPGSQMTVPPKKLAGATGEHSRQPGSLFPFRPWLQN